MMTKQITKEKQKKLLESEHPERALPEKNDQAIYLILKYYLEISYYNN